MRSDFCAFILSHGRSDNVKTYGLLRKLGYTGPIYIVVDNEDATIDKYVEKFGEYVVVFNKPFISNTFDTCDNQDNRKAIVYARNACLILPKNLVISILSNWMMITTILDIKNQMKVHAIYMT